MSIGNFIKKRVSKPIKITPTEIRQALDNQEDDWNFYSERELLENTINQRVNFVIAVYALFITAAATVDNLINLQVVLGLGSFLLLGLTFTTWRVYLRLDIVIQILYNAGDKQVFPLLEEEMKQWGKFALGPMIFWIYVGVPAFCTLTIFTGWILSLFGCIIPSGGDTPTINNYH